MKNEFTVFSLIGMEGIDWFCEQVKKEKELTAGLLSDEAAAYLVWNHARLKREAVKSTLSDSKRIP